MSGAATRKALPIFKSPECTCITRITTEVQHRNKAMFSWFYYKRQKTSQAVLVRSTSLLDYFLILFHGMRIQFVEKLLAFIHEDLDGLSDQNIWRQDSGWLHGNWKEKKHQNHNLTYFLSKMRLFEDFVAGVSSYMSGPITASKARRFSKWMWNWCRQISPSTKS